MILGYAYYFISHERVISFSVWKQVKLSMCLYEEIYTSTTVSYPHGWFEI